MIIGILKETETENRVVLLPEEIKKLIKKGCKVYVENNAGLRAYSDNTAYEIAGAFIKEKETLLAEADILIKINSLTDEELSKVSSKQLFVCLMGALENKTKVEKLANSGITAFSLDLTPRISRAQTIDVLSSNATVSGYKAVLEAAIRLPKFFPMFMTAAGTIRPAKVMILGAGVAGLQAIATARRLGAVVEVFDVRSSAKEEVLSLGADFVEVEGAVEDKKAGGYAVEQTEEFKKRQRAKVYEHAIKADVIICTAQIPGKKAPVIIEKETVNLMQAGSVIIDLAAKTGGNCELTEKDKVIKRNGVTIVGNTNYLSDTSKDASSMISKNIFNFLSLFIKDDGRTELNFEDEIIAGTCIVKNGKKMKN